MRTASRYQNPFLGLLFISLLCWMSSALSFFENSNPSSELAIIPFSNESISIPIEHSMMKRDAFETLRTFTSGFGDSDDLKPTVVRQRLWNSSVALSIPLFSMKLPHLTGGGFIVNQAIYGLFAFIVTAIPFGLSFIFTGAVPTNPTDGQRALSKSAKSSNFNFMGSKFRDSIGMDGLQCLQKVVCQAHRSPENQKYGIMARSVQTLFTAPVNLTLDTGSSSFQKAAWDGRYSKDNCEKLYDCLLDPLGSARYLAHWYKMDKILLS